MKFTKILMLILLGGMLIYIVQEFMKMHAASIASKRNLYWNVTCTIVEYSSESKLSDDKFHKPQLCKAWLVRLTSDTTKYAELSQCSYHNRINLSDSVFFQKKIGDTLHFEIINKSRFFTLKK